VKQLREQLFSSGFDAYPGDEDNGSMACWYIFSSLGFYPMCPGSGAYELGIPAFDEVVLHLSNGTDFVITADQNMPQHQFVRDVEIDGEEYVGLQLKHEDVLAGQAMEFKLGTTPKIL
jgi:putative alpha-1,2-mannosidase